MSEPEWLEPAMDRLKEVGLDDAATALWEHFHPWVWCEERLPVPNDPVLVWSVELPNSFVAAMDADGEHWIDLDDGDWIEIEVNHWMPLPDPP